MAMSLLYGLELRALWNCFEQKLDLIPTEEDLIFSPCLSPQTSPQPAPTTDTHSDCSEVPPVSMSYSLSTQMGNFFRLRV